MNKYFFIVFFIIISKGLEAQNQSKDSAIVLKKGSIISLNISQVSLTNWASGGQSSYSVNGFINSFYKYKKDKTRWDNTFDIGYGILHQNDGILIKTDDKIDLSSSVSYKAIKNLNYTTLLGFKSQIAKGYNYPNDSILISNFMAPGYFILSLGMDYKPNNSFKFMVAPLTGKITVVNNATLANGGTFGVKQATYDGNGKLIHSGERIRREFGAFIKISISKEVFTNVTIQSTTELFSNYQNKPQNIDINWEVLLNFKVNKYISTNINTHLKYDDDIKITDLKTNKNGPKVQFKEVLGIGISYKI